MLMPNRSYTAGSQFRYGFNGKENDMETTTQDYGERIYNPRLGRFLSTDPLKHKYPSWTPYAYAMNDVMRCIDLDGEEKKVVIHWIDGFYNDGTPKIKATSVDINKSITYINVNRATGLPLNDGKKFAGTEVYYAMPDGRFIQQETMYEEIKAGEMMPSANYDYTQNVIPGKQADDYKYVHQYDDATLPFSTLGWWIKATSDYTKRDMAAPDNAMTMEDLGGVNAALTVIGAPMQVRGMQALRIAESNKGWSLFSRNYQKQIAGTEGEAVILNGVKFDGLKNGILLDAKGKYSFLLEKGWAQEGLLAQAQRQIKAANGAAIEWHFAEEAAANTVQQLFKDKGITGISVHYTPSIAQ